MAKTALLAFIVLSALHVACGRADRSDVPSPNGPKNTTWVLSAAGFGPLVAGMTSSAAFSATSGALTVPADALSCAYASWPTAPTGVSVMFEGGTLSRVDITEAGVCTALGLQVGDLATRAVALYGAVAERRPHKYEVGEYLIVRPVTPSDTLLRLVIELVEGRVARFRVGRLPAVEYVEGCG